MSVPFLGVLKPNNFAVHAPAETTSGHRSRSLIGTFGLVEIAVPHARRDTAEGKAGSR